MSSVRSIKSILDHVAYLHFTCVKVEHLSHDQKVDIEVQSQAILDRVERAATPLLSCERAAMLPTGMTLLEGYVLQALLKDLLSRMDAALLMLDV